MVLLLLVWQVYVVGIRCQNSYRIVAQWFYINSIWEGMVHLLDTCAIRLSVRAILLSFALFPSELISTHIIADDS